MTNQPELSELLGEESPAIEFPSGLIGFEEWKHFVLITGRESGPLRLLQSLDDERVSFIVTDPRQIMADYQVVLSEADAQALQYPAWRNLDTSWPTDADLYCILSVQEDPFSVTANMVGPLVINWQAGVGRQVILSDSSYSTRHRIASHLNEAAGERAQLGIGTDRSPVGKDGE